MTNALFVKVLGRDQRDADLLLRTWRSLTLRARRWRTGVSTSSRRARGDGAGHRRDVTSTPDPVGVLGTDDEASVLVTSYADASG